MTTKASIIVKATSVDADGDVTPYSYKLANGRMVEQAAFPYYVYAEELQYVLRRIASEASDVTCSVYTKYSSRISRGGVVRGQGGSDDVCAARYTVVRNSTGGINIGCNVFGIAATRKLAAFAGLDKRSISKYFPVAGR
jgi:hypothetical protein